jgi:hypothetical protein
MMVETDEIVCIEETSVTVRSYRRRTTIPSKIYKRMDLGPEDSLRWIGLKDGSVCLMKVPRGEKEE